MHDLPRREEQVRLCQYILCQLLSGILRPRGRRNEMHALPPRVLLALFGIARLHFL